MTDVTRVAAPAKINLHLRVGPVRADGFHPLMTWMATVGLGDTLSVGTAPAGAGVTLTTDDPALPTDGRNLVVKAVALLLGRLGRSADLAIHLQKTVPAGGGLGGGSSDAAHALLAVAGRLGIDDRGLLAEVAAGVGSDVPFFLYGPSSVCRGRGEAVRPVGVPTVARHAVLVLPAIAMPTADVYRRFDAMSLGRPADVDDEPDWATWCALPAADLLPRLVNDLEPPAFALRPDLSDLRVAVERSLGRPVRMSGSGSTLFTLFDTATAAEAAAAAVRVGGVRAFATDLCPAGS